MILWQDYFQKRSFQNVSTLYPRFPRLCPDQGSGFQPDEADRRCLEGVPTVRHKRRADDDPWAPLHEPCQNRQELARIA